MASSVPDQAEALFRPIATVYSLPEAAVLLSVLRANGILVYAGSHAIIAIDPNLMVALGGIQINVRASQFEDAVALFEASDGGWTRPPPSYARNQLLSALIALGLFLFCGIAPPPRARGIYHWQSADGAS
jgi:hypothetical protein